MLLIGKPSISMGHGFHGYVSHNQRVSMHISTINPIGNDLVWFPLYILSLWIQPYLLRQWPWIHRVNPSQSYPDWWFGHVVFFHLVGNVIIPTDEIIFFRGVGWNHQPDYYLPIINHIITININHILTTINSRIILDFPNSSIFIGFPIIKHYKAL